ncbi:8-hydroxygeraniol dehydrogenase-like [Olea europaea subsp. europaea]|uniref:8-hydroxygeraniol dehydrogenase-like n=1 Tax=Olea europaea subsp. europaea TaxID=158383 RepID=A0A8S0Q564_OLEEU|nr:8-hydroxygeraniol dehydrogenase-like [Olea europaea subsp. europaea]
MDKYLGLGFLILRGSPVPWPEKLPIEIGSPLLCAGITTYSPLRYFGLDKPGMNIGVVGHGGLGHVAMKFANAFGIKITVISTSIDKKKEAIEKLGADSFLVSRDPEKMKAGAGTLDGIIDTVSATHPLLPLISLLKPHGKLVLVGAPDKPLELPVFPLISMSSFYPITEWVQNISIRILTILLNIHHSWQ